MEETIGAENRKKLVRAEGLPLDYAAVRPPGMAPVYRNLMANVHAIIARVFSIEVIQAGKTTDQDLIWWLRQENQRLGFGTWFQPSIRVQRKDSRALQTLQENAPTAIERGDVL